MKNQKIGGIRQESVAEIFFPLRSDRVTKVQEIPAGQGGQSCPLTGEARVPFTQDAESRNIRSHEAYHLDFTHRAGRVDLLDDAIEDARLHRYCSGAKAVAATFPIAREDEIAMASEDILRIDSHQPIDALVGLRSIGILGEDATPEQLRWMRQHLGGDFINDCETALQQLSKRDPTEEEWDSVRDILRPYFETKPAEKPEPEPESEPEDAFGPNDFDSIVSPPPPKQDEANEYRNPVTGESDLSKQDSVLPKNFKMTKAIPPSVRIQRLDMSPDSIHNKIYGGLDFCPAHSGSKLRSINRLIDAQFNPQTRVFARKQEVVGGTILIDCSGSMNLEISDLEQFCQRAPAATIALYNGRDEDEFNQGNIFIFAADGKRATSLPDSDNSDGLGWGGDNLIDYQALRWLLRQDGPRYLITDFGFTGQFAYCAHQLAVHAYLRHLFVPVKNLEDMNAILTGRKPEGNLLNHDNMFIDWEDDEIDPPENEDEHEDEDD